MGKKEGYQTTDEHRFTLLDNTIEPSNRVNTEKEFLYKVIVEVK